MGKKRIRQYRLAEKFQILLFRGYKDFDIIQKMLFDKDFSVEFKNNGDEYIVIDGSKLEKGQYLCRSLKTNEVTILNETTFKDLFLGE